MTGWEGGREGWEEAREGGRGQTNLRQTTQVIIKGKQIFVCKAVTHN